MLNKHPVIWLSANKDTYEAYSPEITPILYAI